MLARSTVRFARLVLATVPFTLAAVGQTPAAAAAWQAFQQEAAGTWLAQWHGATGTPRTIYGEGLALADWRGNSLAEARRHALLALQRWPDLLGLGTSEFRESIGARMGRTWTFTFDQYFRGLPVIGGRVDVRVHMLGRLSFLGSTAWPIPADFATVPKLGETEAVARAWQALERAPGSVPQPGQKRTNRLVVWGDTNAPAQAPFTLAWEVPVSDVDAEGQGPIGRAYVDAATGALLHFANDKHACGLASCTAAQPPKAPVPATYTVMAWTHTAYSPVSTPTNIPLPGVEVVVPGVGTVVTDQNGQFVADLSTPTQVTVVLNGVHSAQVSGSNPMTRTATLQPGVNATLQLGTAAATEQQLAHSTAYYWTYRVNEWARGILGNSPQLATADGVFPTVNIASTCNAYYVANSINFYASGGGCNNTAGASVIAHEWGHGLDDQYGGISQNNGLGEGWGDICSIYLLDDPLIGHDFWSSGGGIRTGNNGTQYPNGSGPHGMGESWMGFAWKLRQNLRTAFGTTQARAISDDIVLGSIAANATNTPDAVVQVFVADDDDANLLNGVPHYTQLVAACNAHSLPYPAIQAGYLTHTPLGLTTEQGKPRHVEMAAIPLSGSFTQVRLFWNDGQPRQRNLVPSGAPSGWHGMLPGYFAPQAVSYHFEALHSNNQWFRLPATGEYQYPTLAERRVWFEDFETGGAGWTHGAATGTDDWEIGSPAGRSGSGWSDPPAAASGTRCAGTDLGITGDGAYAASSETWFRSPPIDCTGLTGVRLRCKAWLSCEGPGDQLEVRMNGVPMWFGSNSPVQASAWSAFEIALPLATNNPTTVFELRCRSNALFEYGGWNIDDVELYTVNQAVPLPGRLSLLPEQASTGMPVTIQLQTNGSQPFLLAIGSSAGPTLVPGIPALQAGGALTTLFSFTNAAGSWSQTFSAPPVPLAGTFWYSHALTLDPNSAIVATNPFVNLFTQ